MAIKPIKRVRISDQVYDQLKNQIIEGEWKAGDKIPSENELAATFEVSRITIRHALQQLAANGLLETRFGEGSFVCEAGPCNLINTGMLPLAYLHAKNVPEVLEFRIAVEVETAGIAVTRATDEEIDELAAIYARMEQAFSVHHAFAEDDLEFHFKIAEMTGNSLIIGMESILRDILSVSIATIFSSTEGFGQHIGLEAHRRILEAFRNRDADGAKAVMREHLEESLSRYLAVQNKEKS